jgi:hypothetical protein
MPSRAEVEAIGELQPHIISDRAGVAQAITDWLAERERANARVATARAEQKEDASNPTRKSEQFRKQ